jgi:hypothetical protein
MLVDGVSSWAFLRTGAEQLPPLSHVITRAVLYALGESVLALRLPAMLGYVEHLARFAAEVGAPRIVYGSGL